MVAWVFKNRLDWTRKVAAYLYRTLQTDECRRACVASIPTYSLNDHAKRIYLLSNFHHESVFRDRVIIQPTTCDPAQYGIRWNGVFQLRLVSESAWSTGNIFWVYLIYLTKEHRLCLMSRLCTDKTSHNVTLQRWYGFRSAQSRYETIHDFTYI